MKNATAKMPWQHLYQFKSATNLDISRFLKKTRKPTLYQNWFPYMVGESGFEPLKSLTTDLQSVPFGHSGTLPDI